MKTVMEIYLASVIFSSVILVFISVEAKEPKFLMLDLIAGMLPIANVICAIISIHSFIRRKIIISRYKKSIRNE